VDGDVDGGRFVCERDGLYRVRVRVSHLADETDDASFVSLLHEHTRDRSFSCVHVVGTGCGVVHHLRVGDVLRLKRHRTEPGGREYRQSCMEAEVEIELLMRKRKRTSGLEEDGEMEKESSQSTYQRHRPTYPSTYVPTHLLQQAQTQSAGVSLREEPCEDGTVASSLEQNRKGKASARRRVRQRGAAGKRAGVQAHTKSSTEVSGQADDEEGGEGGRHDGGAADVQVDERIRGRGAIHARASAAPNAEETTVSSVAASHSEAGTTRDYPVQQADLVSGSGTGSDTEWSEGFSSDSETRRAQRLPKKLRALARETRRLSATEARAEASE